MPKFEYMKIKLNEILEDFIQHYNLRSLVHTDGHVYIEMQKGMPGLKQAGRIANGRLKEHLNKYGYHPMPTYPSTMGAQIPQHNLRPCCGQFWRQTRWQRKL